MAKLTAAQARKHLEQARRELERAQKKFSHAHKQLPGEEVANYTFKTPDGKETTLAKVFGRKQELILVHNMGRGCRYCTLWADGFNGFRKHLENRAAFVVASPDTPAAVKKFATGRSWKFRMVSHRGTTFGKDMGFEGKDGGPWPGVSTFVKKKDGRVFRIAYDYFGPGDNYCGIWYLFDLLPKGADGWAPQYTYGRK